MSTALAPSYEDLTAEQRNAIAGSSPVGLQWVDTLGQIDIAPHIELFNEVVLRAARGGYRAIVNVPPQHGKPVDEEALVLMADGSRRRLADVQVGDWVVTVEGRGAPVAEVHEQGELDVVTITTRSGRSVSAAPDHPMLTADGWVNAGDVEPTAVLASVPAPHLHSNATPTADEARLLGYFVGDGSLTHNNCSVTCADPVQADRMEQAATALGFAFSTRPTAGKATQWSFKNGARPWVRGWGIAGKGSHDKRVPEPIFRSRPEIVAEFIAAYFECDGSINGRGKARRDACVEMASVNRDLLADVQHLLLRFGIQSHIGVHNGRYKGEPHLSYRLFLYGQDNVARFAASIPVIGAKRVRLDEWSLPRKAFDGPLIADEVVAVEPDGTRRCRCLTIGQGGETFTANDFVVHNSSSISRAGSGWYVGTYPDRRVLTASYEITFGQSHIGGPTRDMMERQAAAFPGFAIDPSTSAKGEWNTTAGGGMIATGIGGSITGRRVDLGIIDDPYKDYQQARSRAYNLKLRQWFESVFLTRLRPRNQSSIILVMTRWSEHDLAGWILDNPDQFGTFEHIRLPAIAEAPSPEFPAPDPLEREPGEPLWAEFGDYAQQRSQVGSFFWVGMYQQRPSPEGGAILKRSWFNRYRFPAPGEIQIGDRRARLANMLIVQFADLAISEKTSADYTVITTWAVTPERRAALIDIVREQTSNPRELVTKAYEAWQPVWIGIEGTAFQADLVQAMIRKGLRARKITRQTSKETRWYGMQPAFEAGLIHLPESHPLLEEIERELTQLPTGEHDDIADTVADLCHALPDLAVKTSRSAGSGKRRGGPTRTGMAA